MKRGIDVQPYLEGPIFKPVGNDRHVLHSVRIEGHAMGWKKGADIAPMS